MSTGLTVAIVGLGFGKSFIPLYLSHPEVANVVLVEPDTSLRQELATTFGLTPGYADISEALQDPNIDAVHILAPVFLHAEFTIKALDAGKRVACAVPMATSIEDLERIIEAQDRSGKNYMMMETAVFAREYQTVDTMLKAGEFGSLTLYRGFHIQNLDGFPTYWQGYPPMHYITHALSPILSLLDTTVESVTCLGAGILPEARKTGGFDNIFPSEVGLFRLRNSDVVADITMSFFQTARNYIEGFSLYGEFLGVEWPIDNDGDLTSFSMTAPKVGDRGNPVEMSSISPQDHPERLPEELRRFVRPSEVQLPGMVRPVRVGADHGGSHPHLVHEFISSIAEQRKPYIDARRSAQWTAPGICAHESAMSGGSPVQVPLFD
jgi:predicted dehydrogenase